MAVKSSANIQDIGSAFLSSSSKRPKFKAHHFTPPPPTGMMVLKIVPGFWTARKKTNKFCDCEGWQMWRITMLFIRADKTRLAMWAKNKSAQSFISQGPDSRGMDGSTDLIGSGWDSQHMDPVRGQALQANAINELFNEFSRRGAMRREWWRLKSPRIRLHVGPDLESSCLLNLCGRRLVGLNEGSTSRPPRSLWSLSSPSWFFPERLQRYNKLEEKRNGALGGQRPASITRLFSCRQVWNSSGVCVLTCRSHFSNPSSMFLSQISADVRNCCFSEFCSDKKTAHTVPKSSLGAPLTAL